MTNTLTYQGEATDWTVSEYKDLVDALEAFHDPENDRRVDAVQWNIEPNVVRVTLSVEDVADTDLDTIISEIETLMAGAPNTWTTTDDRFGWG